MPKSSSDAFEIHERPTTKHARSAADLNATQKIARSEIETLVRRESGTRAVVTPDRIEAFVRERTASVAGAAVTAEEHEVPPDSPRERETLDASAFYPTAAPPGAPAEDDALQRHTLVMRGSDPQSTAQQIPIDVDLSRITPQPWAAATRRPSVLDRIDRRQLTIAVVFLVAMLSALAGFVAGRASL